MFTQNIMLLILFIFKSYLINKKLEIEAFSLSLYIQEIIFRIIPLFLNLSDL